MQGLTLGAVLALVLFGLAGYFDYRRHRIPRIVVMLLYLIGIVPVFWFGPSFFASPTRLAGLILPFGVAFCVYYFSQSDLDENSDDGDSSDMEDFSVYDKDENQDDEDDLYVSVSSGENDSEHYYQSSRNYRQRSRLSQKIADDNEDDLQENKMLSLSHYFFLSAIGLCYGVWGLLIIASVAAALWALTMLVIKHKPKSAMIFLIPGLAIYYILSPILNNIIA